MKKRILWAAAAVAAFGLALGPLPPASAQAAGQAAPGAAETLPVATVRAVAAFEGRAKEYSRMRERIEDQMPKLPKEATSEQITAHKTAFLKQVQAARVGARQGQLFTRDVAAYIRSTIKSSLTREEQAELRQTVMEAETKGVPVHVNRTYPESKELVEMPPTLLLRLPQLPKQLRYRFVGKNLLLVDRENSLIVDYMRNALP